MYIDHENRWKFNVKQKREKNIDVQRRQANRKNANDDNNMIILKIQTLPIFVYNKQIYE